MNPDIKEERHKVAFSVEEFARWYHGGEEKLKQKRFLGKVRSILHTFKWIS
jgi:hypothetical protein